MNNTMKPMLQRRVAQCVECDRIVDWITLGTSETTSANWDALSDKELESYGWDKSRSGWICERHS